MKLILTDSIKKSELKPHLPLFNMEVIKQAAKKSLKGLGKSIKTSPKIKSTRLKKIPLTSTAGAGRSLFLIQVNKKKTVLVMLRTKNDKQIGANMSIENPKFKKRLDKNLDKIFQDLKNGDFEEIEL